jgi:hypothetical protein
LAFDFFDIEKTDDDRAIPHRARRRRRVAPSPSEDQKTENDDHEDDQETPRLAP